MREWGASFCVLEIHHSDKFQDENTHLRRVTCGCCCLYSAEWSKITLDFQGQSLEVLPASIFFLVEGFHREGTQGTSLTAFDWYTAQTKRDEAVAQSCESLSSNLHPGKSQVWPRTAVAQHCRRKGGVEETGGLLRLACLQSSTRFIERPCLKGIRSRIIEQYTQHSPLVPQTHIHTHVHTHIFKTGKTVPWVKFCAPKPHNLSSDQRTQTVKGGDQLHKGVLCPSLRPQHIAPPHRQMQINKNL